MDEGNRITYSGIDFMNEGLGGSGGAGVQSKTEQPGMTCLLLFALKCYSPEDTVLSPITEKKLKMFYLSAPAHCEYQLAAAPGPPWFLEYCMSSLGPRVPGLNPALF